MIKTLRELSSTEIATLVQRRISVFKPDDTVSQILGELTKTGRYEALVSSEQRYGLVTVRDLLKVDQPTLTKLGEPSSGFWRSLYPASLRDSIMDIAKLLIEHKVRAVPVVEKGKIVGIISQVDIVNALCGVDELSSIPATKLMQRPVVTLDATENIATARRLMLDKGFSHLPVMEKAKVVGMVTAKILAHLFIVPLGVTTVGEKIGEKTPRFNATVGDVMDPLLVTVGPNASVKDVACIMQDQRKSACVIVGETFSIIGILTPLDLIAVLVKKEEDIPIYILGLTEKENFFESAVAEGKVRRVVVRNIKIHPHITEVSIVIKRQREEGSRVLYQTTARVLSPYEQFVAKAEGWDLITVFDELCDTLDRRLVKEKHMSKKTQRLREQSRK